MKFRLIVFLVLLFSTGQTLDSDLDVDAASVKGAERIEVSGKRFESRTSEVATSVSQEQIENLPQSDRNFLSAKLRSAITYVYTAVWLSACICSLAHGKER